MALELIARMRRGRTSLYLDVNNQRRVTAVELQSGPWEEAGTAYVHFAWLAQALAVTLTGPVATTGNPVVTRRAMGAAQRWTKGLLENEDLLPPGSILVLDFAPTGIDYDPVARLAEVAAQVGLVR